MDDFLEPTREQLMKDHLMKIADLMGMNWDEIDCELYLLPKDIDENDDWDIAERDPQNG